MEQRGLSSPGKDITLISMGFLLRKKGASNQVSYRASLSPHLEIVRGLFNLQPIPKT
ncbi:MAG: hypothetical protein U9N14_05580 [Pseudomonadota bacterium]|nr:hypothetical protein [Pseudomonadota bacterium]